MNVEHFKEDIRSLLTGAYKLPDGRVVPGQAASFALTEMRGRWGSLKSGRRWRGLGTLGDFEHLCRTHGFKVTYNAHGRRGVRGGEDKFCAKAICIHEEIKT